MNEKWLDWAKRLQSISQAGLTFSKDVYDRERYEELREISAEIMAAHTGVELSMIKELFANETGYQTPKMDVRGAVFRKGRILMVKEKMDDKWALPGGFCEVGLSPSENIIKEIKEEAGFDVIPLRLLALLDMHKHPHPPEPYHYYKIFIECEITGGEAKTGVETNNIGFFEEHALPELSGRRNTASQIKSIFELHRNPSKAVLLD